MLFLMQYLFGTVFTLLEIIGVKIVLLFVIDTNLLDNTCLPIRDLVHWVGCTLQRQLCCFVNLKDF